MGNMAGPDGKAFDAAKYNEAADYVINDLIKVNKIGELHDNWMHDPAFPYTMTPPEVYAMLPDKPKKGGGRGKGGKPGGSQQGQDQHQSGSDPNGKPDAVTPADIVQAARAAEQMGSMPVGLDRLIAGLKKPAHSPWAVLRKQVMSALGGQDTATWRRLQRRLITRGIGAPGRTSYGCNRVGVVVDTSGSIGDEILALFGGHMGAILSDARPREIRVYWTDAQVHRVDAVKTGGELRTLLTKPVPGGGGTDMPEGIDAAVADKCEAVVVLTDMYTPFGSKPAVPVIWGAITDVKAPYGTTVRLT
jgi:predicted metal-dependent peptidase